MPVVESEARARLLAEIHRALPRVRRLFGPTLTQRIAHPRDAGDDRSIILKREDRSPVRSYKWRGAFNTIAAMVERADNRTIVAASAGNHAQGVAIACQRLGRHAVIVMPVTTPALKVRQARSLGGPGVEVRLVGDGFDEAAAEARDLVARTGAAHIHPFDDPLVIAGHGTIGLEVLDAAPAPAAAYLQIGGGGMAAGVASALKAAIPGIGVIGVEGEDQACMSAAVRAGRPVPLDHLDGFCDGTAVRTAGAYTHVLCASLIDEFVTVSNDEVCAAMQYLWEADRSIPEPSGAMGLAAALRDHDPARGPCLAVVSGANMDFAALARLPSRPGVGVHRRCHIEFSLPERPGALADLLDRLDRALNIVDFQYGKTDAHAALFTIGFEGEPAALEQLGARLRARAILHRDASADRTVEFRIIPFSVHLCSLPFFAVLDFPQRPGALLDFLRRIGDVANICYFNYAATGESEGHALVGFEFTGPDGRDEFLRRLPETHVSFREISPRALHVEPARPTPPRGAP